MCYCFSLPKTDRKVEVEEYLFSKKTIHVSGCWNVLEILLKDHLLNLAFLITWYCRIAEIELGGVGEREVDRVFLS